ncbi:RICIN domain-containing protein [Streptomyces sp. SID4982]|uniref:RICIN domain-containing protein n=1 Tax=Streptomyces sp. SID4982 TaxID=2690291 RepID=UPI00136AF10C|nr:RICIN domain-containing protein [Streptomyces sp. SID4982]MYS15005.1 ricin-type beta-trefoil lectin domain protein [Streptomyces sp. SID4982]
MAQGDPDEDVQEAPDARLVELLRSPTTTAYPALRELRRRHQPAVLAYARLCTTGESAARRLAAEALTVAARDTARGIEPNVPLRHHLLLLAGRAAASWARDERAAGLDPGLLLVLNSGDLPDGPTPPLLPALQSLASRDQGLVWYGVLEEEPRERTAAYLGIGPADVAHGAPRAVTALAQACLRHRLAASDDPRCADFRRLIEEAVRPEGPRRSVDLDAHKARCTCCTAAFEDLSALRDAPRQTLAEGLLPWGGTAYVHRNGPALAPAPVGAAPRRSRPPWRRFLPASVALGVALVPLVVFLLARPDDSPGLPVAAPAPSQVTVTATSSPSPAVSPTPSPTAKSPSPSRTSTRPAPLPTHREPRPSPTSPPPPPGAAHAQVVNLATGRCLDVRDGDFDKGNDVVTAPCTASPTQRWSVDSGLEVVRSAADPDFCLDSRGEADRGVGIWPCDSVHGRNGQNLRFTVDPDGTVRPEIAIETAVVPDGGDGVELRPLNGGREQRWRAGAR